MKDFIFIFLSFFVSWILMLLPLPYDWQWLKPEWLTLVLIYWVFMQPQNVGVLTAWSVGLVMDILGGMLLGQHALSLVVVAYLARLFRDRHRLLPFWQQALVILMLLAIGKLILLFVQWLLGRPPYSLLFFASTLTSVLIWPWIYRGLRVYERKALS